MLNGTRFRQSNQNTTQHLASTSACARTSQRRSDTQDQTHAGEWHGEIIIGEKEEDLEEMREVIKLKCGVAARACG